MAGNNVETAARAPLVGQPHEGEEGPIAESERTAAELSSDARPLGPLGPRMNRRSPFYIGMTAAAGVAVTYMVVRGLVLASSMLLLTQELLFARLDKA